MRVVAWTFVVLLAGCSAPSAIEQEPSPPGSEPPSGSPIPGQAASDPLAEDWSVDGTVTLGYVAGVGADNFLGDFDVGLTTHEACPRALFYLPDTLTRVSLTWEDPSFDATRPGAGQYTLVVSNPEKIWFLTTAAMPEGAFELDRIPGGVWEVKVLSEPVAVNLLWSVALHVEGTGTAVEDLVFYHDGDCLG